MSIRTATIDCRKIVKEYLFNGVKLDIVEMPHRDGRRTDKYGNESDGLVIQSIPKKDRDAGKRGVILGEYRDRTAAAPKAETPQEKQPDYNY